MDRTRMIDALVATGYYDRALVSVQPDATLQEFYQREQRVGTLGRADGQVSRTDGYRGSGMSLAEVDALVAQRLRERDGAYPGGYSSPQYDTSGDAELAELCERFDAAPDLLENFTLADPWLYGEQAASLAAQQATARSRGRR